MEKIDFEKVLESILILRELEKMPLREVAKQFGEYSNQEIPNEVVIHWLMTGLGNEFFLTSDFLEEHNLKAIQFITYPLSNL